MPAHSRRFGPMYARARALAHHWRYLSITLLSLAMLLLVSGGPSGGTTASAAPRTTLTAQQVFKAFASAGLQVDNVRQQPVVSSPSGPPITEREAWAFSLPEVAPSGGRVLVFAEGERLNKKAAWFRRSGATVVVVDNIILWLDPDIVPPRAARYRQALNGLR